MGLSEFDPVARERVFTLNDNMVDHGCDAWSRLVDQPQRIMTIGRRKWARQF